MFAYYKCVLYIDSSLLTLPGWDWQGSNTLIFLLKKMRLHIRLRPSKQDLLIPFNYAYYLSTAVYSFIEASSAEYSTFLHDHGFSIEGTSKRFKHFCFSMLHIPHRTIEGEQLRIRSDTLDWYVTMPVEESLHHLVIGFFEKKEFYIGRKETRFFIEQVELIPDPEWKHTMKFRMLSPVTVSLPKEHNGKLQPHYLLADDQRLAVALRMNILNKYFSLYNTKHEDDTFHCRLDEEFIRTRGGPHKISKLITIKEGHASETKVRGFMCPLMIKGNPELIKLAYESGLGEKNSLGFGMLQAINHIEKKD
jgi:CRISPR-associated endoribonuclease Cas6